MTARELESCSFPLDDISTYTMTKVNEVDDTRKLETNSRHIMLDIDWAARIVGPWFCTPISPLTFFLVSLMASSHGTGTVDIATCFA